MKGIKTWNKIQPITVNCACSLFRSSKRACRNLKSTWLHQINNVHQTKQIIKHCRNRKITTGQANSSHFITVSVATFKRPTPTPRMHTSTRNDVNWTAFDAAYWRTTFLTTSEFVSSWQSWSHPLVCPLHFPAESFWSIHLLFRTCPRHGLFYAPEFHSALAPQVHFLSPCPILPLCP